MIENACFEYAGKFTSKKEWIHPEIAIDGAAELIVVTKGTVMIEENGIRYKLMPGDVLFLDAQTVHRGYEKTAETVSFYWLHFSKLDINEDVGIKKNFTLTDPNIVSMLFQNVLHYSGLGVGHAVNDRLLYVLLFELRRQSADNSSDTLLVHRVKEWIRLNSQFNLTSGDVAKEFAYNEAYLTRLCKQTYGYGLKELINVQRISFLKRLILESGMSLTEISDLCDFSDYKLFLKYFKYHTGITPSEFRKTYYAIHNNSK